MPSTSISVISMRYTCISIKLLAKLRPKKTIILNLGKYYIFFGSLTIISNSLSGFTLSPTE